MCVFVFCEGGLGPQSGRVGGHSPRDPSRFAQVTYYMQHIVLAGVMADAAMVDAAIEAGIYQRDAG